MNEKYPGNEHSSGQERHTDTDNRAEPRLRWQVSEALLRAVYDLVTHDQQVCTAVATVALEQVQLTHVFDPAKEADQQAQAALAVYVGDQIIELARAYDDLTTSDLQAVVEALAWRLVDNDLRPDAARDETAPNV